MKKSFYFLFLLTVLFTSCWKGEEADLIIHNANIISVNQNEAAFEAMAIKDGKILELGKERQILNKYNADEIVDAKQQTIVPGFIDAHCHFIGYGITENELKLNGVMSMEEIVNLCKTYSIPASGWITGRGWDHTLWDNKEFPTNELLNNSFPNIPILLRRIGGHAAIANKKALELAHLSDTSFISGGYIELINGELSGILMDKAVDSVLSVIPKPDDALLAKAIVTAQNDCFEQGLTTVNDAGLTKREVDILEKLEQKGALKMNMAIMLSDLPENYEYFIGEKGGPYRTHRLNVHGFKFYSDGALGAGSACLLKPYTNITDSSDYGFLLNSPSYFKKCALKVYNAGFQMCTHSIGDSAARVILNVYKEILGGANDKRWRIEHAQVIDTADLHYFRDYSIIPSVQPTHATSDMKWAILKLGKGRIKNAYAYQTLKDQTGMIALGTDFPIENISPIETFYAAVARKNKNGYPKNGYMIEESLSRYDALKGMTIWAALASFEDMEKGSLEEGKRADFVILSQNILEVPEEQILNTIIKATYIDGKLVYKH